MNADETLDREFLQIRAQILQIAAALDRIDRSEPPPNETPPTADSRLDKIAQSLHVLRSSTPDVAAQEGAAQEGAAQEGAAQEGATPDRAARIQHIFSLPYRPHWRKEFGI